MEDGEAGIRVFVDPDLGLDVVVAVPVGGELQAVPLVAHGVVAGAGAVFVDAEDILQRGCACRIIGRIASRGAEGEAAVPVEKTAGEGDWPPTAKMRKFAAAIAKEAARRSGTG